MLMSLTILLMQGQKNDAGRKQRKLFYRDRSGQMRNNNRLRSKESEEKYILLDRISPKPKVVIAGLRNQLTSLRQEVAKISRRDNQKPQLQPDVRLQYQGYNSRQKKNLNYLQFQESKSQRCIQSSRSIRNKSREELTILKSEEKRASVDVKELAFQLRVVQKQNKELQAANQSLRTQMGQIGESIKKEYEGRLRQLQSQREKVSLSRECQNDRTVIIQKQNQEQQQIIEQLRETISSMNVFNCELKEQIEHLRLNMEKSKRLEDNLVKKDEQIKKIRGQLQRYEQIQKEWIGRDKMKSQKIQRLQQALRESKDQKEGEMIKNLQLKKKYEQLLPKVSSLEALIQNMTKMQRLRMDERSRIRIQQLEQVVHMQQKSLENYQSDMNYLQKQLKRLSFLKRFTLTVCNLNEQLNGECVRLNLAILQSKYQD